MRSHFVNSGWSPSARQVLSPHKEARPTHEVSLLVIHNISLPAGHFGTDYVEQLFLGCLDTSADPSFACLKDLRVSAHFFIRRDGELIQFVNCNESAWHAGVSKFHDREKCNDFSIGIELEGTDEQEFTDSQYSVLIKLSQELMDNYPLINLDNIVGHSDIAPTRKTDPGPCFNWRRYKQALIKG